MIIYVAEQNHTQILVVQQLAVDKCIGILHKAYTKTLNGILQTKKKHKLCKLRLAVYNQIYTNVTSFSPSVICYLQWKTMICLAYVVKSIIKV